MQWYSAVEITQSAHKPLASSSSIFLQVFMLYLQVTTHSLVAVAMISPIQPRKLITKPVNCKQVFAMVYSVRKNVSNSWKKKYSEVVDNQKI